MSVRNGKKFLQQALDSISNQSFKDWELIAVNDDSEDRTEEILESFRKKWFNVVIIKNEKKMGLTKSLNKGLKKCQGEFVARLDADDISIANRLEKQIDFMRANPDCAFCGSSAWYIDENGEKIGEKSMSESFTDIKNKLLFNNQFIHSSLFFRKDVLVQAGGYDESFLTSQDYELVLRLLSKHRAGNLPEKLVCWRLSKKSLSWSGKRQEWDAIRARWVAVKKYGYNRFCGVAQIFFRFLWLIVPQNLKYRRYCNNRLR